MHIFNLSVKTGVIYNYDSNLYVAWNRLNAKIHFVSVLFRFIVPSFNKATIWEMQQKRWWRNYDNIKSTVS